VPHPDAAAHQLRAPSMPIFHAGFRRLRDLVARWQSAAIAPHATIHAAF
jgi:hypothetical protein